MQPFAKFLIKCFCYFCWILPRSILRFLGSIIGFLWFDLFRIRRDVIFNNIELAFPGTSKAEKIRMGRKSLYQMGANFAEFFTIPFLTAQWQAENVVFEGYQHLEAAKEKNKGVYLLSMHIGNGDMAASSIVMRGNELYLISKNFKSKWFNDMWYFIRSFQGVKFIEPHGATTPFDILKAIKKKALVVFVLDQYMGPPFGVETKFFGRKTGSAKGLALFVMKTGSPVVPVYTYEGDDRKVHIVFGPEVELASCQTDDKDETIVNMTQKFNDVIEDCIRKVPDQWMWVHKRWKDFLR